eukprot:Clim_evm79s149 gene=Clim_evmTU79s149
MEGKKRDSVFHMVKLRRAIEIPPAYLHGREKEGVYHALNELLFEFNYELGGSIIAYEDVKLVEPTAMVFGTHPAAVVTTDFKALMFTPDRDQRLIGEVKRVSRDHLGLLVYDFFNASISPQNIADAFQYDEQRQCWFDTEAKDVSIGVGSHVVFAVVGVEKVSGIIALRGSMLADGTGCLPHLLEDGSSEMHKTVPYIATDGASGALNDADDTPTVPRVVTTGQALPHIEEDDDDHQSTKRRKVSTTEENGIQAAEKADEGSSSGKKSKKDKKSKKSKKDKKDKKSKKSKKDRK